MQRSDYLLDELEEMFDRIDEDGDRRVGFDEFKSLMIEMGDPRDGVPRRTRSPQCPARHFVTPRPVEGG